jgi:translation elongation factor EF-1alpha
MTWWTGVDVVKAGAGKIHVHTLLDALNDFVDKPERKTDAPMRLPISGIYPHRFQPLHRQGVHRRDAPQARGGCQPR